MNSSSTILLIIIVVLLGFAGYYYLDQLSPMQADFAELQQKNQELIFQVEQLEQKNSMLATQIEKKLQTLSKDKNDEINKLKATYEDLLGSLKEQVETGEVTITQIADQLNVKIVEKIIFPSGKAELSPAGTKVLHRLGAILKKVKDKQIRVEGHTDNVEIHPKLQKDFPSNWELSVLRATNVVRFLTEKAGIKASNIEAAGLGEHRPIASNRTRRGRAQNRRIEILLMPNTNTIQKVAKRAATF